MQNSFLPVDGMVWLCKADGDTVLPLAVAPGGPDAVRRFSSDGRDFGVLDQSGKRLGHYRVLDQAPWFETVRPPATLPKSCVAHALLLHDGLLLAGGHGDRGEALWFRQEHRQPDWLVVALPEGLGHRGKAIDALFVHKGELVAFDNILLPKWILVYPLEPGPNPAGVRKYSLATHTTYERTICVVEGPEVYVLLSSGINHGIISYHLSAISKSDLREVDCRSGRPEPKTEQLLNEAYFEIDLDENRPDDLDEDSQVLLLVNGALKEWSRWRRTPGSTVAPLLAAIRDMAFCADHLVVALGKKGLAIATPDNVNADSPNGVKSCLGDFHAVQLHELVTVERLEAGQGLNGTQAGLYAIGTNHSGASTYEWVALQRLQQAQVLRHKLP